jgi:ornithine cyclodeaminase/alanine dehydrogenase-like protein (mu-crystallin family)
MATEIPDPIDHLLVINRARVAALLPGYQDQMDTVVSVYRGIAEGRVEMPPKIGIHSRPDAFCHAMPAYLRDRDVVALKWVSGYPGNAGKGLPYIQGVIVVNDADTGTPLAILDAAEITAARTAAASAACVARFATPGWSRVALLGCGEQGRYHARVFGYLNPGMEVRAYDPHPDRAAAVWPGAIVCPDPHTAVRDADVVVTAGPIRTSGHPVLRPEWLGEHALILPLDFDLYVGPDVVSGSARYAVDDVDQFRYYRDQGYLAGWPDPSVNTGQLMELGGAGTGRTTILNIGLGALDAAFAADVLRAHSRSDPGSDPAAHAGGIRG